MCNGHLFVSFVFSGTTFPLVFPTPFLFLVISPSFGGTPHQLRDRMSSNLVKMKVLTPRFYIICCQALYDDVSWNCRQLSSTILTSLPPTPKWASPKRKFAWQRKPIHGKKKKNRVKCARWKDRWLLCCLDPVMPGLPSTGVNRLPFMLILVWIFDTCSWRMIG